MRLRFFLLLLAANLIFSCTNRESNLVGHKPDPRELRTYNSLQEIIKQSEVTNDSIAVLAGGIRNDSLRNALFFHYAYAFYKQRDSLNFRYWNNKTFDLSVRLNDTSRIAESYWDLGNFYYRSNLSDSSYYYYSRAYNLYEAVQDDFRAGKMLLNLATIQKNIKDYSGSEVTTIKAIEKIKSLGKNKQLYMAYNNLGIIHNELANYDQSIEYHLEAIKYGERLEDPVLIASSLNNVGVVLHNQREFSKAVEKYNAALSMDSIFYKNTRLYAMLKDNIANARVQIKDTSNVEALFLEALHIRDSIDHVTGIIINKIHLSEYYLSKKDTVKAMDYAIQAKEMSREYRSFGDLLESMLLLAKIDLSNSEEHLSSYIALNDSLQQRERAVRNKFARIRFETDEFIAENEYLMAQRKWMIGSSVGVMFILGLLIVIGRQKARHKELLYEKEQQRINEEIYRLILDQDDKMEKVKKKEKKRISQDLHDGILGAVHGIRVRLLILNSKYDETSVEKRKKLLEDLRLTEEEMRSFSHKLRKNKILKKDGFVQVLKILISEQEEVLGFKPSLECPPKIRWNNIQSGIKVNLYRILQEAMRNVHKYADASSISIKFGMIGTDLRLHIKDNGKGFDVDKKPKGIGIKNMKSRVEDLGGKFRISSGSGGTSIDIVIPIKYEREDENINDRRSPSNPGSLQEYSSGLLRGEGSFASHPHGD